MGSHSISILENNRAMMAILGEKVCLGVPKYRSSIYNPDPRYECGRGAQGCGLGNLYIPSEDILHCTRKTQNLHLYNMPKKGGSLRTINTSRDTNNEVSCIGRSRSFERRDISSLYPHRNRDNLHRNLRELGCSSCVHDTPASPTTSFKCMDCGCRYIQKTEVDTNYNSQCNPCQGPKNPLVIQVNCVPDPTTSGESNGQKTYLFRFNIQQQSNKEKGGSSNRSSNFSSSVWWTCNSPDCDCQNKNDTYESFTSNERLCTIPGKDGQPIPITCHYCFNLNENHNGDQSEHFNGGNKCSKPRNTQKSLHGGSCICAMCERLRSETRKRPNYYRDKNTSCTEDSTSCRQMGTNGRGGHFNKAYNRNGIKNRVNPDHGPLCSCTDHQKCLNNFSSYNSHFGINCYPNDEGSNKNLPATSDTETKCLCNCHNMAPDNWQLDMEENEQICCEGQIVEVDKCTESTPPILVRKSNSNRSRCYKSQSSNQ